MLSGENGIIAQAQSSKEKTEIEEIKERARLDILGIKAGNNAKITEDEINKIVEKYGEISGEGENKIITTEKGYIIKVHDIYNGIVAVEEDGKKTTDLYDGINNPEDEDYNEDAMHIGDYVEYDAGIWEADIPQNSSSSWFGSRVEGQSRNGNVSLLDTPQGYYPMESQGNYTGWRIWDINDDGTITLISAGCPEYFTFYGSEFTFYGYDVEFMLTGSTSGNRVLNLPERDWSMYVNSNEYAIQARTITKNDVDYWYNKYIDNTVTDCENIEMISTGNKLLSTLVNKTGYWIATLEEEPWINALFGMYDDDLNDNVFKCDFYTVDYDWINFGIRVMITISPEALFEKNPQKVSEDSFEYNKWTIIK